MKMNFREIVDYCKETMRSVEYYKPYCEEYISRYCEDDKLFVIDPFSGKRINMLEYDFESPLEICDGDRMKQLEIEQPVGKSGCMSLNDWV